MSQKRNKKNLFWFLVKVKSFYFIFYFFSFLSRFFQFKLLFCFVIFFFIIFFLLSFFFALSLFSFVFSCIFWFVSNHEKVNYCVLCLPTVPRMHPDSPALTVLATILSNDFLHKEIREKGGKDLFFVELLFIFILTKFSFYWLKPNEINNRAFLFFEKLEKL